MKSLYDSTTNMFLLALVLNFIGKLHSTGRLFNSLKSYKMSDPYAAHVLRQDTGRTQCVMLCQDAFSEGDDCRTVGYNAKTGQCHLHMNSLDDDDISVDYHQDWELFYFIDKHDWEVLMRINAGSGVSPSQIWHGEVSPPQTNICNCPGNIKCSLNYRSEKIDKWENLNVLKVKVELFSDQDRVMYIIFDGFQSDSTSWFILESVIETSWGNISEHSSFDNFCFKSESSYTGRSFYVSVYEGDCEFQLGLLLVLDSHLIKPGDLFCNWEMTNYTPTFLYSRESTPDLWPNMLTNNYGIADTLVISVNRF